MHDTMILIWPINYMAKHKEQHIKRNGIIGLLAKLGHTRPILTLTHKMVECSKKQEYQT